MGLLRQFWTGRRDKRSLESTEVLHLTHLRNCCLKKWPSTRAFRQRSGIIGSTLLTRRGGLTSPPIPTTAGETVEAGLAEVTTSLVLTVLDHSCRQPPTTSTATAQATEPDLSSAMIWFSVRLTGGGSEASRGARGAPRESAAPAG
jgi:hypothetical protein